MRIEFDITPPFDRYIIPVGAKFKTDIKTIKGSNTWDLWNRVSGISESRFRMRALDLSYILFTLLRNEWPNSGIGVYTNEAKGEGINLVFSEGTFPPDWHLSFPRSQKLFVISLVVSQNQFSTTTSFVERDTQGTFTSPISNARFRKIGDIKCPLGQVDTVLPIWPDIIKNYMKR